MPTFDLIAGEEVERQALHKTLGGRRYGGIASSQSANVIMLFTAEGGDLTGWADDGTFHFCGEGQQGDQTMAQGNRSVLRHRDDGRALHVFHKVHKGVHRYLGEFELDFIDPWYETDAPDVAGNVRRVIVFRLRPVGEVASGGPSLPLTPQSFARLRPAEVVEEARALQPKEAVEDIWPPLRTTLAVNRSRERPSLLKTQLTGEYAGWLAAGGHKTTHSQILLPGEARAVHIDLMDVTGNRLIVVRHSTTRDSVRSAVGELLDLRRHFTPTPALAVLVPERPRQDLVDLCSSLLIEVVWRKNRRSRRLASPDEGGFVSTYD
ncbi:restriction endonuclease [Streptomyces sp. NPDC004111]|uniref:restriction endonuclease n=1 Tax=Streptomyces sp. NPDC004111 TaxID=3364690 RepID=UPI0036B82006